MKLLEAALVVVGVCVITVSAMLLVRRRAPEGSFFSDGDRASGVFGALATGFSVLLAFMIFLAFESYDSSRSGAEAEATVVAQQVQTAQFLPESEDLTGELTCYARSVAGSEWDAMEDGTLGDSVNPWGVALYETLTRIEPETAVQQSAYDRWLEQTGEREQARIDRVHGAEGIIPTPLWIALYLIAAVIFAYMLFFADRGERAVTQALLMLSVTLVITFSLLLLSFFDNPYGEGIGQLKPTAMNRTVQLIDTEMEIVGLDITLPCDERGVRI